ncbi:DUF1206 domain-containing protein [Actinomycetospora termitidis]|uniref:DUF1206 domain-containing protein n=1 Tax=Actinomycetospora termitidis TaxID=3053470 RepID=A0ABT7MIN6_9PSEU|nr:DUF1206 domain-containing protein [Actinomycetospora sp. Odt1-22]MDL5160540.1 DUF1206 domain-containing protein [Actinomycetospora sp. Odt1-22]
MSIVPASTVDEGPVLDRSDDADDLRDAPAWVESIGRVGLVAYGLVHLGIAVLAVRIAALGPRSSHGEDGHADPRGAVSLVAAGGGFFGRWLLAAAAIALVAFAFWQIRAAAVGFRWARPEERWRKRLGAGAKALGVLSVAYIAAEFATRLQGRRNAFQETVRDVFAYPGGRWLVAVIGLVAVGMFVSMTYTGVRATFMGDLVPEKLAGYRRRLTLVTGSVGNLTRAITFGVVGVLTVAAAINDDPDRIGGVDIALRTMASYTVGAAMFVVAALGFAAYCVYCVMDAYARHP